MVTSWDLPGCIIWIDKLVFQPDLVAVDAANGIEFIAACIIQRGKYRRKQRY